MQDYLSIYQQRFQDIYPSYLPENDNHIGCVYKAVHYSFAAGGKRLRPALMYALAESIGIALEKIDALAVAIECIHTYSLIHDDLPDMDDDDMRRGNPSCHKQFNNATAILAGDALNTLAFNIIAHAPHLSAEQKIRHVQILSECAGIDGMIAGQDTDITCEAQGKSISIDALSLLHTQKTAKMIEACLLMAYYAGENPQAEKAQQLSEMALSLGLLYQIQDDILDITQSSDILGKPAASDIDNNKSTYVSIMGLTAAQKYADELAQTVTVNLQKFFGSATDTASKPLDTIIQKIFTRSN